MSIYKTLNKIRIQIRKGIAFVYITLANNIWLVNLLFVALWIVSFYYGLITYGRILISILIILIIYLYKNLTLYLLKAKPTTNIYILLFLLKVDKIKSFLIYIVIYLYVWLFDLLDYAKNSKYKKLYICVKVLRVIVESMLINIILLIIHKFYYILYKWMFMPFKELIRNRLFGMVLAVLIFTHIVAYVIEFLNHNILNVYIFILVLSVMDDISENNVYIKNYKYYNKFNYVWKVFSLVQLLNFHKDISWVLSYRSRVSIIAQLIKKNTKYIVTTHSRVDKYAFEFMFKYGLSIVPPVSYDIFNYADLEQFILSLYERREVFDYDSFIRYSKLLCMKISTNKRFNDYIFRVFYGKLCLRIEIYSYILEKIELYKAYKLNPGHKFINYTHQQFTEEELIKLEKVSVVVYKILKLILFYVWNICKLLEGDNFDIYSKFQLKEVNFYKSPYLDDYSDEVLEKIEKEIVRDKDFNIYREFYEQMYLYISLIEFHDYRNPGMNCGKHKHVDNYIAIFYEDMEIINEYKHILDFRSASVNYESAIEAGLNLIRLRLIKEWEEELLDLTNENFYEKNYKNLNDLNNYVKLELKNNKNDKY